MLTNFVLIIQTYFAKKKSLMLKYDKDNTKKATIES